MELHFERLTLIAALLLLAGCGGGGGDSSAPSPPPTTTSYAIGGTTSGVDGTGLTLQLNSANDVTVTADGAFTFPALASGASYTVAVKTQPTSPRQTCSVTNGSGTVASSTVTNVAVSCRTLVAKFIYVPNPGSGNVSAYAVNANTGALTAVAGSPFPAGISPGIVTPDPSEKFLYSSNGGSMVGGPLGPPTITEYSINSSTGALTEIPGSPLRFDNSPQPGAQSSIAFDPSGKFGYATAFIAGNLSVFGFSVDAASGALAPVANSPFALPPSNTGTTVIARGTFDNAGKHFYAPFVGGTGSVAVYDFNAVSGALTPNVAPLVSTGDNIPSTPRTHPNGKYLYVPNLTSGSIAAYTIDAVTGSLSTIVGSPYSTQGNFPIVVTVHPSGRFVYAANGNSFQSTPVNATVAAYAVNSSSGVLTPIAGAPFSTQGANQMNIPSLCQIDVHGRFLFVNNSAAGSIAVFSIDQTSGALTNVPGSPFSTGSGSSPSTPVPDPSGKYLYVPSRGTSTISAFAIDKGTGALTLINTQPTGGASSNTLAYVGLQ
jgi:6-phosphogluconolactonase